MRRPVGKSTSELVLRYSPVLAGMLLAVAVLILFNLGSRPPVLEENDYLQMAKGNYHQAYYYYAGRVLHPFVVHQLARLLNTSDYDSIFRCLTYGSLIALYGLVELYLVIADGCEAAAWFALPLLATPPLIAGLGYYYIQDLFFVTLCALFFLIMRFSLWLSLPILLLLHLTRESTILLSLALIVTSVSERRIGIAAGVLAVAAFGVAVTNHFVHQALPNKHGLSTLLFDGLKMLYNGAHTFGLVFWTDTNAAQIERSPIWTIDVHFGNIRRLGFCGFDASYPALTFLVMSSAFGILPLCFTIRSIRDNWRSRLATLDLRTAALYGAVAYAITPLIGSWTSRYVLYAFPLFWMTAPLALSKLKLRRSILSASIVAIWIPFLMTKLLVSAKPSILVDYDLAKQTTLSLTLGFALQVLVYAFSFMVLREGGERKVRQTVAQ